jgi:PAS domain S-box-containing protein
LTIYSTVPREIGEIKSSPGFLIARDQGLPASKLGFHDAFNSLEGVISNRNIVETYVPVDVHETKPGEKGRLIIEIYTDVTPMVAEIEKSKVNLIAGLIFLFAILYGILVLIVRRAARVIDQQYEDLSGEITERLKAELGQQEGEALLNSIIENAPVGLLIKDADHIVEWANSTYLRWYGYDADTMVGHRSDEIEDYQSAEEVEFMNAQEREVLATGRTQKRQVERPFADGQIHTINITKFPVYDQQGNITKVGSVTIDLTEQVRVRKALALSERRFRDAIESIPNGVAILDENDCFVICNNAYRRHLEKVDHLLVPGTPFEDLVRAVALTGIVSEAQEDAEAYIRRRMDMHRRQEPFLQHVAEGDRWVIIHDYKTADGNAFHVRTDITGQKAAEEALRKSEEKHRHFSEDVAHELRTPLALLRIQFDNLENTELIKSHKKDVDDMSRLVSQIMATTQIDSFSGNPNDEADLRAIGTEVVKNLAPLAFKGGRSIELTGIEHPVMVRGNGDALEIAVRNLVENAIQYSARETVITVHVSDEAAISVTNIGQSISPEKRNTIFQRFRRADRRSGGAGLGLSIVQRVVDTHQATIEVSDVPGGGAVFKISFPSPKSLKIAAS